MIGIVETMFVNSKLRNSFRKPGILRKFMRRNIRDIGYWIVFVAVLALVYKFASDGSFSAILTLASLFQCFGFALLVIKVTKQSSAAGISVRSLLLFLTATGARLFCNLRHHAYLPVDKSGDWVYQVADAATIMILLALIVMIYGWYSDTYPEELDSFTPGFPHLTTALPVIVSFGLALLVRPRLASSGLGDFAWSFGLYLEPLAMLPQLFLMSRIGGEVEALTSHYVASIATAKILSFTFWAFSFSELAPKNGFNIAGWAVILAHSLQLILLADFLYHYIKSIRTGRKLILSL